MTPKEIREYAKNVVQQAIGESDKPKTCKEYKHQCNPRRTVQAIRTMLDHPHQDDSPCEDPVWEAVDGVLNQALNGIEAALDPQ